MAKKYRGKDILEELETKEKSPILPIVIFLCVVTVLSIFTTIGIKLLNDHTDIEIPWLEKDKKDPIKIESSRDQMDLVVPTINVNNAEKEDLDSFLRLVSINKDKEGFRFVFSLKSGVEDYVTIEAKQITIDGFYFTTTFALSDRLDYDELGRRLPPQDQKESTCEFVIKKTELDAIDMFGFNKISIVYDISTPTVQAKDKEYYLIVSNDLNIVNERKGIINIDTKNNIQISYYKTLAADDATYIYFDFNNMNKQNDTKVYVKELIINNQVYDMSSFVDISHRNSREAIFLKIPTKDIARVNTMKVRFFLVDENKNGEKSFYITDEYQRAY